MTEQQQYPDIEGDDILMPGTYDRNEETVRKGFWSKLKRNLARVPLADQVVAAYYAAFDPATPFRTKAMLLAALAYFVMPFDVVPDFILGFGFTDDMTVLLTAFGLIRSHVTDAHLERARETVEKLRAEAKTSE
ncbi:YkvA family protein [Anderseniella sp. Alg231-50]|uniref:YkvA family protein n=1 Tax=Anderseniella sp. Alg231-50 TaxID=1922226 RepID=UPI00307B248C